MFFEQTKLAKAKLQTLSTFNMVDPFSLNFDDKQYNEFTDNELLDVIGSRLVFDVESYWNYFIISFKCVKTRKIVFFEDSADSIINIPKLFFILANFCIVGFNSRNYDIWLIAHALCGHRAPELKRLTNAIIHNGLKPRDLEHEWKIRVPKFVNHIDLIEVAPLSASLKLYGGRLHTQRMQELPIDPEAHLSRQEAKAVKHYNINDLDITIDLDTELQPALELRNQLSAEYRQDLRSRSDAQIAEHVISGELAEMAGYYPKKPTIASGSVYRYPVPPFLAYYNPRLTEILQMVGATDFVIGDDGYLAMPKNLESVNIPIGECVYKLALGGLHSTEKCSVHKADENTLLLDKDVASYYPSIILNLELAPKHLGKNFLTVYGNIVNRRLAAKKAGNKVVNESLKITINGSFGKLGNKYSAFYAPDMIIQVLMTGQLSLLMLIDILENLNGYDGLDIKVVSANTDGILIKCSKNSYDAVEQAVKHWEQRTGFVTEEARYKSIHARDVNNYIAIKENGDVKVKGCYSEKGSSGNSVLSKNPEAAIVNDAIIELLTKGTGLESTIRACKEIRKFVVVRNVKGGAEKSGIYLGKAIRWYYSTEVKGTIVSRLNGNKVPNTNNAMPAMELPAELPADLDVEYYIRKANEILYDIGYLQSDRAKMGTLF